MPSDVDECADSPCVNAVACVNTAGAFTCQCMAGWEGERCHVNVQDCNSQCLNAATCIDLVDRYICACPPGYTGECR